MNYIGSKQRLSDFIISTVTATVGQHLSAKVFCDLFAGTGIVGRQFKPLVKQVISNDLEYYSYVLNRNYIGNHLPIKNKEKLLQLLNRLEPQKGFIYHNYCNAGGGERMYFKDANAAKIDAVRRKIEAWKEEEKIDLDTYYFLLASLLESADKVANTASVYGAFLKKIKKSASEDLVIKAADFFVNDNPHLVYNEDSNSLIGKIQGDILYLDPPYNARQYGANYHLLNTIALYDCFLPKGKTGLRDYNKSSYCSKLTVAKAFEEIIAKAQFKYIFLSYNNEGLMPLSQIKAIMQQYGHYDCKEQQYQRFKADKTENRNHKYDATTEYLHILEKNG